MAADVQRHNIKIIMRVHTYPVGYNPTPQVYLSDDRVHFFTIAAMTGNGVSSGEEILLELHEDTFYTVVGQLDFGIER
jgi:hypothetical protein